VVDSAVAFRDVADTPAAVGEVELAEGEVVAVASEPERDRLPVVAGKVGDSVGDVSRLGR